MNIVNYLYRFSSGYRETLTYDSTLKRLQAINDERSTEIVNKKVTRPIVCKFCKSPGKEDFIAIADEEGLVSIENTVQGRKSHIDFTAHNNAIFDLEWSDGHDRLLLGSGDQTASVWDVRESTVSKIQQFAAHSQSVRSVTFRPFDKDVFATGGRDGLIVLWDARCASSNVMEICEKPENIIHKRSYSNSGRKTPYHASNSICSLLFQDSVNLFSSTILDCYIDVWDLRKNYSLLRRALQPLHKLPYPFADTEVGTKRYYTSMCLNTSRTRLYANSCSGSIHCFDVASYSPKPVSTYSGHTVLSSYIKCCLSPDDKYLVCGSSDWKAYVWNTAEPGAPLLALNALSYEVSYVDWCKSGEIKIATCCDQDFGDTLEPEPTDFLMLWKYVPYKYDDDNNLCKSLETKPGTIQWLRTGPTNSKVPKRYLVCRPIFKKYNKIDELNSPTMNLPNHVIDGTSPNYRCSPSSRKEKENRNWLSSLKKKTPSSLNSRSVRIKKSKNGHKPKACGNLLKFFKTASAENNAEKSELSDVSNFPSSSMMSGVMEI